MRIRSPCTSPDFATQADQAPSAPCRRVDPELVDRITPDGFAWWGHDVRQEITAPPRARRLSVTPEPGP